MKSNKIQMPIHKKFKTFSKIKKRITRKKYRQFDIQRATKILDILPQFIKFYNKLSKSDIIAIKYYKGPGSYFQSQLLSGYDSKKKSNKLYFPFHYQTERALYRDIVGMESMKILPLPLSIDIKDIMTYIRKSYGTRITLLNRLDKIYDMKECPHLTGNEILFRGMSSNPELKKIKEGGTFIFKNFISTTVDRKIAEEFSNNDYIFVMTGLKNIPFLYMPNTKISGDDYVKEALTQDIKYDFSEYTLPRNLEFDINKIIEQPITESFTYRDNKNSTIKHILKTLSNKGYGSSSTNNKQEQAQEQSKEDIVEKVMFNKAKFVYCTFKKWHPRTPIKIDEIMEDAELVLDKGAINSWKMNVANQDGGRTDGLSGNGNTGIGPL